MQSTNGNETKINSKIPLREGSIRDIPFLYGNGIVSNSKYERKKEKKQQRKKLETRDERGNDERLIQIFLLFFNIIPVIFYTWYYTAIYIYREREKELGRGEGIIENEERRKSPKIEDKICVQVKTEKNP